MGSSEKSKWTQKNLCPLKLDLDRQVGEAHLVFVLFITVCCTSVNNYIASAYIIGPTKSKIKKEAM
ncbi:uncharacterized protein G2W53_006494 [Senna tora]|uniref:Uncharacterized protein n=1 Tax=Senna tora TaxID=362788 RepID=A0A834X434_9FABA|nr:uncharacterized protein G2W53_006494 [Senna tora]